LLIIREHSSISNRTGELIVTGSNYSARLESIEAS
jgi:hypothetical protein